MNKKILFVIDNIKIGGAEQVFTDIVNLMDGYIDFDVLFITSVSGESYTLPNTIRSIYLNRRNKWNLCALWRCYITLKNYNIIHIHMRHTYRYIALVKKIFNLNLKLILHDHYGLICIDKSYPFRCSFFFKPDVYLGVSEELKDWAISTWQIPPDSVHTFINLPSTRFVQRKSKPIDYVEKRGELVLVGNIKPVKNQLFALDIAKELGLHITLIGKDQEEKYSSRVSNAVSTQSADWLQNVDDVSNMLPEYQLGIFCSLSESGPLVILEYLLCGLPFLAYKTGGIAEILSRYFPIFFLDTFDKETWKKRIGELLERKIQIDTSLVSDILIKEFNSDVYRNRLLSVYEK